MFYRMEHIYVVSMAPVTLRINRLSLCSLWVQAMLSTVLVWAQSSSGHWQKYERSRKLNPRGKSVWTIFKNATPTSQTTHYVSITNNILSMLLKNQWFNNHKTHIHGELSQLVTVTMLRIEWPTNQGSIPVGGQVCVLFWGPLNLPSNGYRSLFLSLGVKGPARECDGWLPHRMVHSPLSCQAVVPKYAGGTHTRD
jgi:hypothetical protein